MITGDTNEKDDSVQFYLFFEVGELFLCVFEVCKRGCQSKFLFNW